MPLKSVAVAIRVISEAMLFNARQFAQLGLNPHAARVGIVHHLFRKGDIFFKRQVRTVDHHGGEAPVDAVAAHFKAGAVVQMHHHGDGGIDRQGGLHQLHERVRQGFRALAEEEPERFAIIDAAQPPEDVVLQCRSALEGHLRQRGRGLE